MYSIYNIYNICIKLHSRIARAQHEGIGPRQQRQTHEEQHETAMVVWTHTLVDPHLSLPRWRRVWFFLGKPIYWLVLIFLLNLCVFASASVTGRGKNSVLLPHAYHGGGVGLGWGGAATFMLTMNISGQMTRIPQVRPSCEFVSK